MNAIKLACGIMAAAFATTAFSYGCMLASQSTSGMNKTCVYRCPEGAKSITIKSTDICPVTI